jgi:hypothetical protein
MIARDTDVNYSRGRLTWIALVCLIIAHSITVARCDDQIRRLPDGRYLVQVKDVTVALPEEDPKNKRIGFYLATPPGTSPFHFYLTHFGTRSRSLCAETAIVRLEFGQCVDVCL